MRDILVGSILLWLFFAGFRRPWVGILGWTWLSIMNPHALSWRLQTFPVAVMVGGSTLLGMLLNRDQCRFFMTRESVVLVIFMLWMSTTLPFAMIFPDEAFGMWDRVMKIDFMILVAMFLLYTKRHINLLVWVLVISIGFYGVKGGAFTLATGGNYRVWGPTNTYIEGNNEVALAIVIVIPLMRFLQLQFKTKWAKLTMGVCMVLMAAAALGSHSRGALLALGAMGLVLWWRGKNRFVGAIGLLAVSVALLSFMPAEWWHRMDSIETYKQDESAMGRINAWWMAFNLAKSNFFGGSYAIWTGAIFAIYAPDPNDVHAAHSIYFMVLGEHGFIGLFLFLLFFSLVYFRAGSLRSKARKHPETQWLSDLGNMIQVALVGYAVGGAFLSLSYWDLPYNLMVLAVAGTRWLEHKRWLTEPEEKVWVLPAFLDRKSRKRPPSLMA